VVTGRQAQPPPAEEPVLVPALVLGADGDDPDEPLPDELAVKLPTDVVTLVPAGDTSHHFAPKPLLPCPLACPGPESPAKKYSGCLS
jgi:hypothetical protein